MRSLFTGLRVTLLVLLLVYVPGCQHSRELSQPASASEKPRPRVKYSKTYDEQIRAVFDLARKNQWEDAEVKATALYAQDPENRALQRLYGWVKKEGQLRREQAVEDRIREIESKASVFSPTVPSLLKERRERGLPPRKDVRDTVEQIESTPYIPDSYGKTIREKGPLFDFESAKGRMAEVLQKDVVVHVDNIPLEVIIQNLSQSAGVNFVADKALPALKQNLTAHLDKVKLGEFLRYVARNYDLQFQVGPELVWVVDAKDPKRLMEETRFYRLRKGFILPAQLDSEEAVRTTTTAQNVTTVTETQKFQKFVNDAAPTIPSIERAITNLFTGSKYMIDYERNLIVARGTPEQLDVLEKIIREFDKPIQQVLIEARFVTISKPAFMRLGVLWETGRQIQAPRSPVDFTGLVGSQDIGNVGIGIQETFTNVLSRRDLSATISALEQSGESQTLSAPRLTVLNNRPATIRDGKVQYYYEEYTVKTTVQQYYTSSAFVPTGKPSKITAGATLNVLASISGDGRHIVLALNPIVNTDVQLVKFATVSDFDQSGRLQSSFDINLPQYRTQEMATRAVVRSGETVVMGGVLERQRSTFVESVPVLGDLPIIGALFRRRTEADMPRYLLVFVTATIVADTGEFVVYDDTADQAK
jgi:type IV pilus assembly protein PilQ